MTDDLRKLAEAATPGPWSAYISRTAAAVDIGPKATGKRPNIIDWPGFDGSDLPVEQNKKNAAFIAAANPAKIIELLDTIDRLTAETAVQRKLLERARDALERVTGSETFYRDPKGDTAGPVIEAITQHLQPQEGEKK